MYFARMREISETTRKKGWRRKKEQSKGNEDEKKNIVLVEKQKWDIFFASHECECIWALTHTCYTTIETNASQHQLYYIEHWLCCAFCTIIRFFTYSFVISQAYTISYDGVCSSSFSLSILHLLREFHMYCVHLLDYVLRDSQLKRDGKDEKTTLLCYMIPE